MTHEYGEKLFWDSRYEDLTSETELFEWYNDGNAIKPCLEILGIHKGSTILDVGCGTSGLAEVLYDAGYKRVTGVDWSEKAVSFMTERNQHKRPEMKFVAADCSNMESVEDDLYDFVVDKGFLDSVICGYDATDRLKSVIEECFRVMRPNGYMVVFSYAPPIDRTHLLSSALDDVIVKVKTVPKPTLRSIEAGEVQCYIPEDYVESNSHTLVSGNNYYLYILNRNVYEELPSLDD